LRDREVFECEKLLLRDISDRPVAAYDGDGLFALNTLYSGRSRPDSALSLEFVLAVVNSTFSATYFQQVYGGTHVNGGYLRCKPMFAANLPIPVRRQSASAAAATTDRETRDELARLATGVAEFCRERASVTLSLPETTGPRLGDLDHRVLGTGSMLEETTTDRSGLRIGRVVTDAGSEATAAVERAGHDDDAGCVVVAATVRYRPERSDRETDEWGFAETDPIPAFAFEVGADRADLIRGVVPRAAEGRGFTPRAGKTISPLDRLRAIRLPRLDDARGFLADWRRASALDADVRATDAEIDRRVYRSFGLSEAEVAVVERLTK
jgi:hypothetical protein